MSHGDPHPHATGPRLGPAAIGVLTVSDTRDAKSDRSGAAIRRLIEAAGHRVAVHAIVRDDAQAVRECVATWLADPGCDAVITSGGTGVASRDRTYEAVGALLELRLDGFGELFRSLSYAEIGSAAMLSRAVGGIARGKPLFVLPGATAAVSLGVEKLILPELDHLRSELAK